MNEEWNRYAPRRPRTPTRSPTGLREGRDRESEWVNNIFQIQITTGDIINLESGNHSKYYMLSATGTWDEIIKLQ